MEATYQPQLLCSLDCESRTLHPGLQNLVEERLRCYGTADVDPSSAAELLGLLAAVLQNACAGRVAADYADSPQEAMQDCVRLAGAVVSWMAQGAAAAVASCSPETCTGLKDFVAAALDLASHSFFSPELYQQLGPARYVQIGNAARGYVRDLAPAALDATEACWRAVEQQLACGDPTGEELLEACRALFGALFEGLRHLGTTSAERINDPAVPREMRSFAGLNILWTGLSRVMTALPPEALQQLLSGGAVQSVLRALLGYLVAEVRAMATSPPAEYEARLKVSRFWLQHAARVAQAHPAAAAACWDELASATSEVYGRIAAAGSAAAAAQPGGDSQPPAQTPQQQAACQLQAQVARDLDSAIACKMTSLLAVVLDAGCFGGGGGGDAAGGPGSAHGAPVSPASPQQLEARLAKLEALAQTARPDARPETPAAATASTAAGGSATGAVLLCLALLQRAAHVSPEARAVMASRSLPWVGAATALDLYDLALDQCGPAAVTPCLDLPHQLAAAALSLLAAAAEQHGHSGTQDVETFTAGCAVVCSWGACAHPLLFTAAADVLATLVQHCEPQLAVRLIAAVARLARLAAAAEAAAAAAVACDRPADAMAGRDLGTGAHIGGAKGIGGRLERLLVTIIAAAPPQAESSLRLTLEQMATEPFAVELPGGPAASLDLCGAAGSRTLWGAAAGVAAVQAAAAVRTGLPAQAGGPGPALGAAAEQELSDRARKLLAAVRQAAGVLGTCTGGLADDRSGGGSAWGGSPGPMVSEPVALARHWLGQLLGCVEVTVAHMRHLGMAGAQSLVAEAAELAAEMVQVLCPESLISSTTTAGGTGCGSGGAAAEMGALHAGARLVACSVDCLGPAGLTALAPALTWLAQNGPPAAAADVAVVAAHCNAPPPEALFHSLLRNPHAAVLHAALQSQVHVCRTVPQQYAAAVRRLFPPDFAPAVATARPANAAAGAAPPPLGGASAQLAAVFKSYMARKLGDDEEAAAVAAVAAARSVEAERLADAVNSECVGQMALGRQAAAATALRRAVERGTEAMQTCAGALALRRSASDAGCGASDPMATDAAVGGMDVFGSGVGGGGGGGFQQPLSSSQQLPHPQRQQSQQQQQPQHGASGGGPLTPLVSDDNTAMHVLKNALGGLERALGALHATVLAQGINKGRPADWDQLQVHARALLGDLSSATSRIRNMNELLYALQGR